MTTEMKWQPIETAPKDGSEVLIYGDLGGRVKVCWWNGAHWQWEYDNDVTYGQAIQSEYATHWMPLPAPPAEEGE